MTHSTLAAVLLATPFAQDLLPLTEALLPCLHALGQLLLTFRQRPLTPQATCQLEQELQRLLRELGRLILQWLYNHLEPAQPDDNPRRLVFEGETYRRRGRHPNTLASCFGPLILWRFLYEPLEPGTRSLHPLERRLGIEAGIATPALAERVGQWAAQHPQRVVRDILKQEHDIAWSCTTLRTVTASLAAGLAPHRQAAQGQRLLEWLRQAQQGRGPHRPVLVVGRDGIHVPLREDRGREYREGATATVSVYDRRGKRLGTVYLGQMPEAEQVTLSAQLTALLQEVLRRWPGPRPRLAYVTDAGWHPTQYFRQVLRRLEDPQRPGQRLVWERIIDFYHACGYISKLAAALFGESRNGYWWARRMRRRLKEVRGVTRVLQSAAYHRSRQELTAAQAQAYTGAYRYLQKRRRLMEYARYRRQGLPLGSGVTEAACKTVFTQRLKQSGMAWKRAGGQVIVDLRVLWLSGVWGKVQEAYRNSKSLPCEGTTGGMAKKTKQKAA